MPSIVLNRAVGTAPYPHLCRANELSLSPSSSIGKGKASSSAHPNASLVFGKESATILYSCDASKPSRYLILRGLPSTISEAELFAYLRSLFALEAIRICITDRLRIDGTVTLVFYDTRFAAAYYRILVDHCRLNLHYVKPELICRHIVGQTYQAGNALSRGEGPFLVSFVGPPMASTNAYKTLATFGAVAGCRLASQTAFDFGIWHTSFVVDWYDDRCASAATAWLIDYDGLWKTSVTACPTSCHRLQQPLPAIVEDEEEDDWLDFNLAAYQLAELVDEACPAHQENLDEGSKVGKGRSTPALTTKDSTSVAPLDLPDPASHCRPCIDTSSISSETSSVSADTTSNTTRPASPATSLSSFATKESIVLDNSNEESRELVTKVQPVVSLRPAASNQSPAPTKNYGVYRDDNVPLSNIIRLDHFRSGQETRTTLMIKNIPNRLSASDLMRFIDESLGSRAYSFLYLRIDFKTRNNVGYAFVDFNSPKDALAFCDARLGTRWDLYSSDKLVLACFAKVQGRDSLVKHFRNSAIMEENAAFRPKLFDTAGREESWPACDNAEQKARSNANKTKVGLFPPRRDIVFKTVKIGAANPQKQRKQ